MSAMDYETAMARLRAGPPPEIEPIDHAGQSIGCVGRWPDGLFLAITPSGVTRDCASRKAAVWWLKETAAGRDPDRPRAYGALANGLALLLLAAWVVSAALFVAGLFR
jgi:hypothetical protein